jgi:tellurite resistance protein TerC
MLYFWLGFFALVALLLFLDLGVFHRKSHAMSFREALGWTIGWVTVGVSFTAFVYLMYEQQWFDARFENDRGEEVGGFDAASAYLAAYLLEYALSVDNIFVISLIFTQFRVPSKYQHRILFWGIMGAIFFRVTMLGGGVWLAKQFAWIFYLFGAYLAWQGFKLLRGEHDDEEGGADQGLAVRLLRRMVRVVEGDHGGRLLVHDDRGRRALTTLAVCLIVVELTDIVFALDSIPAVLSVTKESFIVITSNIFAIMGLRALYFVLAGAMAKFHYLKMSLAILLMVIGAKMILHNHVHLPHWASLSMIAGILSLGVIASLVSSRGKQIPADDLGPHVPHETVGEVGGTD